MESLPLRTSGTRTLNALGAVMFVAFSPISSVWGQAAEYPLRIEVLIQPQPAFRVHTQEWGRVLQSMERTAVFRSGRPGERTRVENQVIRGRKSVTAVGIMNRDGSVTFLKQRFVKTKPLPMTVWFDKLEQFGAMGPPNEHPTWGLTEKQFGDVLKLLATSVNRPVDLKSPGSIVATLNLPAEFHVSYAKTADDRKALLSPESVADSDAMQGLSKGSVLSASLAQFGLGFRVKPGRTGQFLLEIDAGTEADNMYPVGWKNTAPITTVVPTLWKRQMVGFEDGNLEAVVQLIGRELKLPLLVSSHALSTNGTQLAARKYSRKPSKITMESFINSVGKKNGIGLCLRTDEAGNVFLWVTTQESQQAFRKRFSHVKIDVNAGR